MARNKRNKSERSSVLDDLLKGFFALLREFLLVVAGAVVAVLLTRVPPQSFVWNLIFIMSLSFVCGSMVCGYVSSNYDKLRFGKSLR